MTKEAPLTAGFKCREVAEAADQSRSFAEMEIKDGETTYYLTVGTPELISSIKGEGDTDILPIPDLPKIGDVCAFLHQQPLETIEPFLNVQEALD